MDARIILAGQNPPLMDSYAKGQSYAQAQIDRNRQNSLADLYKEQGANILAGEENALKALAGFSPQAAMGVQAQQQEMQFDQEKMQILRDQAKRDAAKYAATLSATQRQAEADKIERGLSGAAFYYKNGDKAGYENFLRGQGVDPAQVPFEQFPAYAQVYSGAAEALKNLTGGNIPTAAAQTLDWRARQAGLQPGTPAYQAFMQSGGKQQTPGLAITLPDGTTLTQGVPPGQNPLSTATPRDGGKLAEELSKADAASIEKMNEQASTATDLESLGNQLEQVAPNVGYTGPGGNLYGAADDLIGVLPGDEGARGAFRSLAMEAQLTFTEKTKGAITDREMGMFREAVPNLGQRKEANKAIAQVMQAGAKRVQSRAQFFEAWARKNGSLEGAQEVWSDFMRDNPILEKAGEGIKVRPDGDWRGYLNRKPAASYTPEAIMGLSAEELSQIPLEQMTAPQIDAIEARFGQLGMQ